MGTSTKILHYLIWSAVWSLISTHNKEVSFAYWGTWWGLQGWSMWSTQWSLPSWTWHHSSQWLPAAAPSAGGNISGCPSHPSQKQNISISICLCIYGSKKQVRKMISSGSLYIPYWFWPQCPWQWPLSHCMEHPTELDQSHASPDRKVKVLPVKTNYSNLKKKISIKNCFYEHFW